MQSPLGTAPLHPCTPGVMVKIDADTLYSLDDLRSMLRGVVELGTFLDRLGLRKERVFRDAIWGSEILRAVEGAKPFGHREEAAKGLRTPPVRAGRGTSEGPVRRLGAADLQNGE